MVDSSARTSSAEPPRRRRMTGYTLVELVVVLGIVLVILGLVVPSIGSLFEVQSIERAADVVAATMGEARARAIRAGERHYVAFIVGTEASAVATYASIGGAAGNLNPDWTERGLRGEIHYLPLGVSYAGTETRGTGRVLPEDPGPPGGSGGDRIYLPGVHRYADKTVTSDNLYPISANAVAAGRFWNVPYDVGGSSGINTVEMIFAYSDTGHVIGDTFYTEGRGADNRPTRYCCYFNPDGSASGNYRIVLDTAEGLSKVVAVLRLSGQAYVRDPFWWEYP
jgi:type II secretory pathway pseudopilin PulG